MRALSLTLSVAAVDVPLLALAVVAVAVGPLDDAGRAAGLVAVAVAARRRRLLDEVHGHEGRHQQEHARGLHLAWMDLADFTLLNGASGGWMLFLLTLNVQLTTKSVCLVCDTVISSLEDLTQEFIQQHRIQ